MKISASIYSDKKRPLKEVIEDLVAHNVNLLHVDCNDDLSVFNDIEAIRTWCNLPIDLHIITEKPELYYDKLREVPVEYLTFQYEQLPQDFNLPLDIKGEKGLAITTPTSIEVFKDFEDFDFLLVMATIPGQSGGVFDPINFQKIRNFKKLYPRKAIHVDGGVNAEVSFILRNLGVRSSVSGSYLFKSASVGEALMNLTNREHVSSFCVKDFMEMLHDDIFVYIEGLNLEKILTAIEVGNKGLAIVKNIEGLFMGIITNADVRRFLLANITDIYSADVTEMINKTPVVIEETATVEEMLNHVKAQAFPISYLPAVSQENKAVGMITFVNLIKGEL